MQLYRIITHTYLRQSGRALIDRYRFAPLVLLLPVGACILWYAFLGRVLQNVIAPDRESAHLFITTLYNATLVFVFVLSGVLSRLRNSSYLIPGSRALPIHPTVNLAAEAMLWSGAGIALGLVNTLPAATHVLLPRGVLSASGALAVYGFSLLSWTAAAALGTAWSRWMWAGLITQFTRTHYLVLHLAHAVLFAASFLLLGALTLGASKALVMLPVWALTHSGIPALELLGLFLAAILVASAADMEQELAPETAAHWVPLLRLPVHGPTWHSAAIIALKRLVRDPRSFFSAALVPLIFLGFALAVRTLPQLAPLTPIMLMFSAFVIPASLSSMVLASDLHTFGSRWLLALPISPVLLAVAEAAAYTGTAILTAVAFNTAIALVLGDQTVDSLLALTILTATKTVAMSGLGLALTCLFPKRGQDTGSILVLGLLFTVGTGLVEIGFSWLPDRFEAVPTGVWIPALAVLLFATGVSLRSWLSLGRNRHGLADQ